MIFIILFLTSFLMPYDNSFYMNVYHIPDGIIVAGVSDNHITGMLYQDDSKSPYVVGIFQTNNGGEFVKYIKNHNIPDDTLTLSINHNNIYYFYEYAK